MQKLRTKKNPLTKAQNQLLRVSLKRLLGDGLIKDEKEKEQSQAVKKIVLRNALNALLLD
jgi:hypothetical protein